MSQNNNTAIDPYFQKGRSSVEHRNIDSAGDDHPFGDQPKEFEADLRSLIRRVADDLYDSWEATTREYLANAETACLKVEDYVDDPSSSPYTDMIVRDDYQPKIEVTWNKKEDSLIIKDNGIGMAAVEVDEIFRQIGRSAARDDGTKSGQFGQGALSFVKMVGLDNSMIMISHSRLNDDNSAYLVSLAGVEPIMGSLDDDEYGTKFQLTPKKDMDIRQAVETYSEYQRVPVLYKEIDRNGQEVFNEDWGDKSLHDQYSDDRVVFGLTKENCFEAYCCPEANGETLLLSMDIDRNDGRASQHGAPFTFDIRLLDESGRVIKSTNGNEGLMPCPQSDYDSMLVEARHPYISEDLLNNKDVVCQNITDGPNAGAMLVDDSVLDDGQPLPPNDYIGKSDLSGDDVPGEAIVLIGPNKGKTVVTQSEWDEMDEGRAELYVPENQLEEYDHDSGEGDLTLPEPTSDRDRLQDHEVFWEFLGSYFADQFDQTVDEIYAELNGSDDVIDAIMDVDPNTRFVEEL